MELVKAVGYISEDPYGNGKQKFTKLVKYVDRAIKGLGDNTVSAIEVAHALYVIRELELYKSYPKNEGEVFVDFNDFAQTVFKAKKSTIANYIALYERFGADSPCRVKGIPPKFEEAFSYTQLLLMLPLSATELQEIKSSMSCSEIKQYVKEHKDEKRVISNRLENGQENTEEAAEPTDLEAIHDLKSGVKAFYNKWSKLLDKYDDELLQMRAAYANQLVSAYDFGVAAGRFNMLFSILDDLKNLMGLIKPKA